MSRLLFIGVSSMKDHAGQHKLYFLSDLLSQRGVPVSVLVPDIAENRAFFTDKPSVQAHFYAGGNALQDLLTKSRFVRDQGPWSAVWIVGVGVRSFILRRGAAGRVPIIKDFDEFPSMISSFGSARRAYLRGIERLSIAQANGFTCASAFLENAVRRQRPDLGTRLLRFPVAISAHEHRVDPALVTRLRAAAGTRPTLLYIGSVWRFYEDQLDEMIQLAVTLRRRGSSAQVRVLGGGPDLEYFKQKSAQAGMTDTLEFAGHVARDALASHMEAADVLVFPFAANPFNLSRCPTKAFHYAAANRPLVTNRTGEVAALFGEHALYYPEGDVEALASRCEEALALARAGSYNNQIPFPSLTWSARAETFLAWLASRQWLPPPASPRR